MWVVILKDIISRLFNYAQQNDYLNILIRCVLGIDWREGGGGAFRPPITFDY